MIASKRLLSSLARLFSIATAAGVAVSLAACGGHSQTVPARGGSNGLSSLRTAQVTFVFTVPKKASASRRRPLGARSPQYVSSATQSISVALSNVKNAGNNQDITPSPLPAALVVNVPNGTGSSPGSPCVTDSSNPGNYLCTVTDSLYVGIDSLAIKTFDQTNAAGNVLSEFLPVETVVQGVANTFAVTLDANVATVAVSGTAPCTSGGPIGAAYGSVGTNPATFTVGYTDPAGKTIINPGQPALAVTATGVTNGALNVVVNQSTQTFTVTPTQNNTTGTLNVSATPPNASDGLSFNRTKSFTFQTGPAPPGSFLAAVEQTGVGSGQVDLFTVALGGIGGPDSFSAYSPATLATTNSINQNQPDVDNPLDLVFDSHGDLLIGNGGTTTGTPQDNGNLACVPAGAIATGANTATTVTTNVDDPVAMAYDSRDGSVALGNNPASSGVQLAEYLLSGTYAAAPSNRNITAPGMGTLGGSVVNLPTQSAGTYAIALTNGLEVDPAHGGTGSSKIAMLSPTGSETDILPSGTGTYCGQPASPVGPCALPATYAIDDPFGIAWDAHNNQLVISNFSTWHRLVSFYTISPIAQVNVINTGGRNTIVAASPDGHVAVVTSSRIGSGYPLINVYDNTAARGRVGGPIPFNSIDNSTDCGNGTGYIYGDGVVVNSLIWLSNTKLLVALQAFRTGTSTASNGLYIFDISATATPAGVDDASCSAYAPTAKQTAFVHINNKPLGAAYVP